MVIGAKLEKGMILSIKNVYFFEKRYKQGFKSLLNKRFRLWHMSKLHLQALAVKLRNAYG